MTTLRDRMFASVRIEHPGKNPTIVNIAPGAEVPPHSHPQGYVVIPFAAASLRRTTHEAGKEIRCETVTHLPMVSYYVDPTRSNQTITITNLGLGISSFQKIVSEPPISGPQPELPTERLTIITKKGRQPFTVEVASTLIEQATGLMFRKDLHLHHGMLFVWSPRLVVMYMRNVRIPLDIIFITEDGTVSQIHHDAQPNDSTPIPSEGAVIATLEVAAGTAKHLGVEKGDRVEGFL